MSTPKRIITLNIGSQTISLAEFRPGKKKGSINLYALESREFMADPAADATRVSQAMLLLGEMVAELKVKKESVRITLPAQATFSRMVKVPSMGGTDLAETVSHEAKQNIPYPLEEVVWDYRTVFETAEHDPEVLIVAAKTDILEDWTATVQAAALNPTGIELSSVALLNAFRYNYGEPEGCSLLIDLGARTTNLIFVEPGKFFIRTISTGGSSLTAAVAKEFGENFFLAESRKVTSGYVAQGSNFADASDPEVAKLSKVLRNAATRLHAEVARSISFYRSQQGGSAPQRVFLCGGGASVPMMMEFWEEKLGIPAENFNPLRCIGLTASSKKDAILARASLIGEHVGLALQAALDCPVSINILPPAVQKKKVVSQYSLVALLATACICAPLVAWGMHLQRGAEIAQGKAETLNKEIEEAKKWDKEIKGTRDKMQAALKLAEPLERAAVDRRYWVTLLETIHACLPKELVWVTNLELVKPVPPASNSFAPKPATPAPVQKLGTVRLILKGFYLENPKGVEVVDEFGMALRFKSSLDNALGERMKSGTRIEPDEIATIRKAEVAKIKIECESARWNSANIESFCERLGTIGFPDQATTFQVAPIQDWVRPNTPSATEWAQEFVIPLDLLTPPITFPTFNP
jgi:type IV pilus assembly protein PilM